MGIAERLFRSIENGQAKEFVSILCAREKQSTALREEWLTEIVAQRERRERKKYSPSERQRGTLASYEKDADDALRELVERMGSDSDEKKIGLILFSEMEAFISDEQFWGDLLSGAPRTAMRRLQRFRLSTVDMIWRYDRVDRSLANSRRADFDKTRKRYEKGA